MVSFNATSEYIKMKGKGGVAKLRKRFKKGEITVPLRPYVHVTHHARP